MSRRASRCPTFARCASMPSKRREEVPRGGGRERRPITCPECEDEGIRSATLYKSTGMGARLGGGSRPSAGCGPLIGGVLVLAISGVFVGGIFFFPLAALGLGLIVLWVWQLVSLSSRRERFDRSYYCARHDVTVIVGAAGSRGLGCFGPAIVGGIVVTIIMAMALIARR